MILYVETNFPISIATGRDPQATNLLQATPASIQIAIPSICYMEALYVLSVDLKSRNRFDGELRVRLNDAERNLTSASASLLSFHLKEAVNQNEALLKEIKALLPQTLSQLATKAEMINLTADILQSSLRIKLIEEQTDNLILNCILNHAQWHAAEVKVLLSGNTNDFGKPEVREVLRNAGVENYFSRTQEFLSWLQSQ